MKPQWYAISNIQKIKKRSFYYAVYLKDHEKPFFIDLDDLDKIKGLKLRYDGNYIQTNKGALHRIIQHGPVIHHKTRNKLDNRKINLQVCQSNKEHFKLHWGKDMVSLPDPLTYYFDDEEPYSRTQLDKIKFLY